MGAGRDADWMRLGGGPIFGPNDVRTIDDAIKGIGPRLYLRSEPMFARWAQAWIVCNSKAGIREWLGHGSSSERLLHFPNGLVLPPRPLTSPFANGARPRIGML